MYIHVHTCTYVVRMYIYVHGCIYTYMDVYIRNIHTYMDVYIRMYVLHTYTYIYIHIPAYTYVLNYDTDKVDGFMGFKVFLKNLGKFPQTFVKTLQRGTGLTREANGQKRAKYVAIYLVRIARQI